MNRTDDGEHEVEMSRVRRVYATYHASGRRRRAWAADNPGNIAMRQELLTALLDEAGPELRSGAGVLDVGCGTGFWLEALRARGVAGSRLTGVDIMPTRVVAAAERVPDATVRRADARALPFEDGCFEVVLLFTLLSSLDNTSDVRRALNEGRRVLAPSGVLLCYEPALPNPLNRQVRHIRDRDFDAAGLRPRREQRVTLVPPLARRLGRATSRVYPRLARFPPLRSHRLVAYRVPPARSSSGARG